MRNTAKILTEKRRRHMLSAVRLKYGIGPQNRPYQSDDRSQPELYLVQRSQSAPIMPSSSIRRVPFAHKAMNLFPVRWTRALTFALAVVMVGFVVGCRKPQTCAPPPQDDSQLAVAPAHTP